MDIESANRQLSSIFNNNTKQNSDEKEDRIKNKNLYNINKKWKFIQKLL